MPAQALINLGHDLSRAQQQRREGRDAFWTELVAALFNKSTVTVFITTCGFALMMMTSYLKLILTLHPSQPAVVHGLKKSFFNASAIF